MHTPLREQGPGQKDDDIGSSAAAFAETEGFEPSIGLYNPITV
jgi:hypothetical protein